MCTNYFKLHVLLIIHLDVLLSYKLLIYYITIESLDNLISFK